jgi:lysophospholipase L1-like esterase
MKLLIKSIPYLFCVCVLISCSVKKTMIKENDLFLYKGRVAKIDDAKAYLIGSGASVSFRFNGKKCAFYLSSIDSWEHYNYFVVEVDGNYKGRFKIEKGTAQSFFVEEALDTIHNVSIYKATEAANGKILFNGEKIDSLVKNELTYKKKIEFIGNSITCGMGNDMSIPCHTGEWFDQHNAYWAYGPILARKLNADFLLSSVSGIGMYRNWNDENELNMPQVYENLSLNTDTTTAYTTDYQPDLVSICLGTNDLSDGDGIKKRLPFNEEKYMSNYIRFIQLLYKRYPKTSIVLLSSPMLSGEKNATLLRCLKKIIKGCNEDNKHKPIQLFEFPAMQPRGCDYHPSIEDHKLMALQMEVTFKQLLNEK